ncbi:MAG: glucose-6-phosphate isomerase family protein [Anaerolineae bacterium]
MADLISPFTMRLDFQRGVLDPCNNVIERHLSDMRGMYLDEAATEEAIEGGDPLLYEVYQYDVPFETGQLLVVTSIIQPGKLGDEYYMTKGHFHEKEDRAEVYLGLGGQGHLLLETRDGEFKALPVEPGTVTYIPPYWAHRMVNTGQEELVFFGVFPADAGHNYDEIEKRGFAKVVVDRDGEPTLVPNPKREKR